MLNLSLDEENRDVACNITGLELQYFHSQVYVVMGGFGDKLLSSTETLQLGEDAWRESTALPHPLYDLRAATLDNIIYITGEMIMLIVWSL